MRPSEVLRRETSIWNWTETTAYSETLRPQSETNMNWCLTTLLDRASMRKTMPSIFFGTAKSSKRSRVMDAHKTARRLKNSGLTFPNFQVT